MNMSVWPFSSKMLYSQSVCLCLHYTMNFILSDSGRSVCSLCTRRVGWWSSLTVCCSHFDGGFDRVHGSQEERTHTGLLVSLRRADICQRDANVHAALEYMTVQTILSCIHIRQEEKNKRFRLQASEQIRQGLCSCHIIFGSSCTIACSCFIYDTLCVHVLGGVAFIETLRKGTVYWFDRHLLICLYVESKLQASQHKGSLFREGITLDTPCNFLRWFTES